MSKPAESQSTEIERPRPGRGEKSHRKGDRGTEELGDEIPARTGELSKRDWTGPSAPPVPNAPPPAPLQKE